MGVDVDGEREVVGELGCWGAEDVLVPLNKRTTEPFEPNSIQFGWVSKFQDSSDIRSCLSAPTRVKNGFE